MNKAFNGRKVNTKLCQFPCLFVHLSDLIESASFSLQRQSKVGKNLPIFREEFWAFVKSSSLMLRFN